jgi:hypothetical protein
MQLKDIAILVLGALVVLLIGVLIGRRKTEGSAPHTNSPTHIAQMPSDESAITHAVAQTTPQPVRPVARDYSKQIAESEAFHRRAAQVYAAAAEEKAYSPFGDAFDKINSAYERFNVEKEDHSRSEVLELFSALFGAAKFGGIQTSLSLAASEVAKEVIEYYDEQVSRIFEGQHYEKASAKYRLSADLRASQLSKISAILVAKFSAVIVEAKEIDVRREWLSLNYDAYIQATAGNFDWGTAARHFGAGALAVANPLIGVPALIANLKFQSDKEKAENAKLDRYAELCDEFEKKLQSLRPKIVDAAEQFKAYVQEKFSEVNVLAVSAILSELSTSGHIIDHYFKLLDYDELQNAERDVLSNGAKE